MRFDPLVSLLQHIGTRSSAKGSRWRTTAEKAPVSLKGYYHANRSITCQYP
jgi:hypothetical protein